MEQPKPAPSPWSLGDFHVIGAAHTIAGDLLCEDAGLGAGHRVLDVACGSGNTALAAARRGNRVTGLDLIEHLLDRARIRANAEGYEIDFHAGNCEQLPFEDECFDYVFSTFGVMFAPDQQRAANELLRVCRRGGTIGVASWTPESMPGAMFEIGAKYGPPRPAGSHAPIEWGTAQRLRTLFGDRAVGMRLFDRVVYSRFLDANEMLRTFRQYFGPVKMLFDAAPPEQHEQIAEEFRRAVERYNRAVDGTLSAAMTYINVILTKA